MRNFHLPKAKSAVSIGSTTKHEGNRNPYSSGIFLPTDFLSLMFFETTTLKNHHIAEFAVRATRRDKTDFIRANNAGYSCVAVEPLSHPTKGDKSYLLINTRTTTMKTIQNLTALLAGYPITPQNLAALVTKFCPVSFTSANGGNYYA